MGESLNFGAYQVTLIRAEDAGENLTKRVCEVIHDGASFETVHLHFTGWPDRSVVDAQELAGLIELISATRHSSICVHCSAGVGRTGTVVTLLNLYDQVSRGAERVSVLSTAIEVRGFRPGLIETAAQYQLVYNTLCVLIDN